MSIYSRTGTAEISLLSLQNRIFWNISHEPHFHNAISYSVRIVKIGSVPMVWIFFLSTNRNFFHRNQLQASTSGPDPFIQSFYLFQIESSETFLTSHISTKLYHIVSGSSKLGQFRWSGFFSNPQTGTIFTGINYKHLPADRNRLNSLFISSKSNFLELFSRATFPQCYIILCQDRQNWVSSDGLDFFPINKSELFSPESTTGVYFRTGPVYTVFLSFSDRIFWNISHEPHFHKAISYSVRIVKIGSVPMVWIFSLSMNRKYFHRNQL